MTLKEFLQTKAGKKTSQSALAAEIGITRGYMNELVHGRKEPSLRVCYEIEKATNGQVRLYDWLAEPAVP